jgi:Rha family phage regulatory protein
MDYLGVSVGAYTLFLCLIMNKSIALIENKQTITSLEVSEITGKPHSDLMKAIRKMEEAWVELGQGNFSLSSYKNKQNKSQPCYELTKTECLYIATKFNDEARAKLVLRWKELEENQTPKTFAQALRLAADQAEKIELQQSQIQGLEEALDESEQWISIVRASKEAGVKETKFNWRALKKFSIDNGIEIKTAPCPRFGTKKLYHISVFNKCYPKLCSFK